MKVSLQTKLILVEGLTGSGKSILAHYLARQFRSNALPATWVHEGEEPHPVSLASFDSVEAFQIEMVARWKAFAERLTSDNKVWILEASFFNNFLETLFAEGVEPDHIADYANQIYTILEPLAPKLIYWYQDDVASALRKNFLNRGQGFQDFVVSSVTSTQLARQRDWQGYEGMLVFWSHFVDLTNRLYTQFPYSKLKLDTGSAAWRSNYQKCLTFLGLSGKSEPELSYKSAIPIMGQYKARNSEQVFTVLFEQNNLTIDIFLRLRTKLILMHDGSFEAEGWPFTFHFDESKQNLVISGRNVDYLPLAGIIANKSAT